MEICLWISLKGGLQFLRILVFCLFYSAGQILFSHQVFVSIHNNLLQLLMLLLLLLFIDFKKCNINK